MVTGQSEGGYDVSMEDCGFMECENGHSFLEGLAVGKIDSEVDDWRYEIPAKNCPICSLTHITDSDLLSYILKVEGMDAEILMDQLRNRFDNWTELQVGLK
jgi:hypothetical protein